VTRNIRKEEAEEDWRRREEERKELERKREHEKQMESLRVLTATQQNSSAVVATATTKVSVADELEKLASLRDRGLLTPEEFDNQKRAILKMPNN
jgi:hypothetical protein